MKFCFDSPFGAMIKPFLDSMSMSPGGSQQLFPESKRPTETTASSVSPATSTNPTVNAKSFKGPKEAQGEEVESHETVTKPLSAHIHNEDQDISVVAGAAGVSLEKSPAEQVVFEDNMVNGCCNIWAIQTEVKLGATGAQLANTYFMEEWNIAFFYA